MPACMRKSKHKKVHGTTVYVYLEVRHFYKGFIKANVVQRKKKQKQKGLQNFQMTSAMHVQEQLFQLLNTRHSL